MAKIRAHLYISGRVQGVFFRDHTRRKALSLGVNGFVRNLLDGRVEAVFEGEEDAVRKLIEWCHEGPPLAQVEKVEVEYEPYTGEFDGFEITYS
jgi:acylphosphatase